MWDDPKTEYRRLIDVFRAEVRKRLPVKDGPYDTPQSPHPSDLEAAGRMLIQLGEMERHYASLPDPAPIPDSAE